MQKQKKTKQKQNIKRYFLLAQKMIYFEYSLDKPFLKVSFLCSSIIFSSKAKKSKIFIDLIPTRTLEGEFLIIKIKWSKFSISSLDCYRLVNTLAILKLCWFFICEPIIPSLGKPRKIHVGNYISCFVQHNKGFSILGTSHLTIYIIVVHFSRLKWWHHCWKQFAQKKSSFSLFVASIDNIIRLKQKYICNKKKTSI